MDTYSLCPSSRLESPSLRLVLGGNQRKAPLVVDLRESNSNFIDLLDHFDFFRVLRFDEGRCCKAEESQRRRRHGGIA